MNIEIKPLKPEKKIIQRLPIVVHLHKLQFFFMNSKISTPKISVEISQLNLEHPVSNAV